MIILDTNVLSALMRQEPEPIVVGWLDKQPGPSVWTTSVTLYELRFGVEILAPGRQRRQLEEALERLLDEGLQRRILPFDKSAADAASAIASKQRRAGRPVEVRDVEIAGITACRKATLATRNIKHFEGIGLSLVDPWSA